MNFSCKSLLLLNIEVINVDICLHFLDGRFNQLHTLIELQIKFVFLRRKQLKSSSFFFLIN